MLAINFRHGNCLQCAEKAKPCTPARSQASRLVVVLRATTKPGQRSKTGLGKRAASDPKTKPCTPPSRALGSWTNAESAKNEETRQSPAPQPCLWHVRAEAQCGPSRLRRGNANLDRAFRFGQILPLLRGAERPCRWLLWIFIFSGTGKRFIPSAAHHR